MKIKLIFNYGNFKKTENTVNETKFCSYTLKLTATWDFIFLKRLELTVNETA